MHGCDIVSEDVKGAIKLILVSSQWGGDDCGMRGKAMWAGQVHILNFIFKTLRLTQNNIADNRWQLGVKLLKLITKHERVSISFDEFLSAHDFNLFILKLFFFGDSSLSVFRSSLLLWREKRSNSRIIIINKYITESLQYVLRAFWFIVDASPLP